MASHSGYLLRALSCYVYSSSSLPSRVRGLGPVGHNVTGLGLVAHNAPGLDPVGHNVTGLDLVGHARYLGTSIPTKRSAELSAMTFPALPVIPKRSAVQKRSVTPPPHYI